MSKESIVFVGMQDTHEPYRPPGMDSDALASIRELENQVLARPQMVTPLAVGGLATVGSPWL